VFFYPLYVANEVAKEGSKSVSADASRLMSTAWRLLAITWFIHTVADVTSKTVFGLLLCQVALSQARAEKA
jgi:hypothetical protein